MPYAWIVAGLVAMLVARAVVRWVVGRSSGRSPAAQRAILAGAGGLIAAYLAMAIVLVICFGRTGRRIEPAFYVVTRTNPRSGADGKLVVGDRLLNLNHDTIRVDPGETLNERVEHTEGRPILVRYDRGGAAADVTITPTQSGPNGAWRLGVETEEQYLYERGLADAVPRAFEYPHTLVIAVGGSVYARIADDPDARPPGATQLFEDLRGAFSHGDPATSAAPIIGILFLLIVLYDLVRIGVALLRRA